MFFCFSGASSESVDLLPSPEAATDLKWSKNLSMDEGHESDQLFEFDGVSSALSVSPTYLDHALAPVFTISTWMKHNTYPNQDKHAKEHILCSADDHSTYTCRIISYLRVCLCLTVVLEHYFNLIGDKCGIFLKSSKFILCVFVYSMYRTCCMINICLTNFGG